MHFHFLRGVRYNESKDWIEFQTYHLEGIELLLDLLSKHWRQAIAGRNLASSIVFAARPCIMELNPWTKCGIAFGSTRRCIWNALRVPPEFQSRHEIVFAP